MKSKRQAKLDMKAFASREEAAGFGQHFAREAFDSAVERSEAVIDATAERFRGYVDQQQGAVARNRERIEELEARVLELERPWWRRILR